MITLVQISFDGKGNLVAKNIFTTVKHNNDGTFECANCARPIEKNVAMGHSTHECPHCHLTVVQYYATHPIFCANCGKPALTGNYCSVCGNKLHN